MHTTSRTILKARRLILPCLAVLFSGLALPLFAAPGSNPVPFVISTPSAIPGAVLSPGNYTIQIVNRLSDRVVLRVEGSNGTIHSTFLAVEDAKLSKPRTSGPLAWANPVEGTKYLRGWSFNGAPSAVEFVYPKDDAVKIATANPAKVPAVDPGSEGKPVDNTLSQSDMELLNLWLLHLEQVEGVQGSIKAERYQQAAAPKPKPVIAALPHMASLVPVPLVWLCGFASVLVSAWLRVIRRRAVRRGHAALGAH